MASGTEYYVPIHNDFLEKLMDKEAVDQFVRDRLRRAEKIINELRNKRRSGVQES